MTKQNYLKLYQGPENRKNSSKKARFLPDFANGKNLKSGKRKPWKITYLFVPFLDEHIEA